MSNPKSLYSIIEDKIMRGDEQVARFTKKKNVKFLSPELEKYKLPVNALLKREGLIEGKPCGKPPKAVIEQPPIPAPAPVYSEAPPVDNGAMDAAPHQEDSEDFWSEVNETYAPAAPVAATAVPTIQIVNSQGFSVKELERMLEEAKGHEVIDYDTLMTQMGMVDYVGQIPPRPAEDKCSGDKTAAVVEWYLKFKPREFLERYKVTHRGMVKQYDFDGKEVGEKEMFMGERKTHITAKTIKY
jgi:hypothetical protein